jgi:hypothetical protein
VRVGHYEAHFVTDGNPILRIDSGGAIGARCAVGEYGSKNEKGTPKWIAFSSTREESRIDVASNA